MNTAILQTLTNRFQQGNNFSWRTRTTFAFFISIFILNKISKLVILLFLFNRVQPPLASGISPVTSVPIPGKFQDIRQKNWPPGPQGLASTTPNHAIPLYPPLSISLPSSFYPPLSLPLYFSISNPVHFMLLGQTNSGLLILHNP